MSSTYKIFQRLNQDHLKGLVSIMLKTFYLILYLLSWVINLKQLTSMA